MASTTAKQRVFSDIFSSVSGRKESGNGKPAEKPVLEQFLFAILREGTTNDQAERSYKSLRESFFDWNEIRVSSPREIADALLDLPDAEQRAHRIIEFLQEVFETTYSFDLEPLHKKGLKIAAKQLSRYAAANDYCVSWVVQQSLAGHALPLDEPSIRVLTRLSLIDNERVDLEAARSSLEHAVPKAKGSLFTEAVSLIANDFCFAQEPDCKNCPVHSGCPSCEKVSATLETVASK